MTGQPNWGYEGEVGPAYWGRLDPCFALCADGRRQSPIDLTNTAPQGVVGAVFHYQPSQVDLLYDGYTIQMNYSPGSYIELDRQRYDLINLHFHTPGEHILQGQRFPMEMHLVHKSGAGNLAVVGVLVQAGANHPAFQPILNHLPAQPGQAQAPARLEIETGKLLPAERTGYHYSGSLTTPPCSEGVSWLVMTRPVELLARQLAMFTAIHTRNNRPVQPLNDRPLFVSMELEHE